MNKNLSIMVPNPCHENWDGMTPQKDGRYCASCEKVVIDFTKMTDEEIKNYFMKNEFAKTCGHFNKHQLENPNDGFRQRIYNAYDNAHKIKSTVLRFISLCVLSITLLLLGCSQPTRGKVECTRPEKLTGDSIAIEQTTGILIQADASDTNTKKTDSLISQLKNKKGN